VPVDFFFVLHRELTLRETEAVFYHQDTKAPRKDKKDRFLTEGNKGNEGLDRRLPSLPLLPFVQFRPWPWFSLVSWW
jgi:hypothetical protein